MDQLIPVLKRNGTLILQITFGLVCVLLGIFFIRHEQAELAKVKTALMAAKPIWVLLGMVLLMAFVVVQGMMYQVSFSAIQQKIRLSTGISLYLKRNLVSVFLPAGMVTNMMFFNQDIEDKEGINKTQTYFASSIFSISSILSGIIVGLPALVWLIIKNSASEEMVLGIGSTITILGLLLYLILDIFRKGKTFILLEKKIPKLAQVFNTLSEQSIDKKKFWVVLGLSILIEIIGISHLYIAILALGGTPTLQMAIIGYAIALLLLMSSPFLRGIGAIEVALTYALTLFGLSTVLAMSVAFLFRFFEFWGVLILGIIALLAQRDNMLLRIFPAGLFALLGLVNILSGITPALPERLKMLKGLIPVEAIHASTWLVILLGVFMLAISVFLIRGLRNAWVAALIFSGISLLAHLTKGIDWEEAIFALITLSSLIYQRKQYFIKPDLKLAKQSWLPGLAAVIGVIVFGTIGFYFLNPHHFNLEFTLGESFQEAVTTFFLLNADLIPATTFGKHFLYGMNLLGGISLAYLVYLLLIPFVQKPGMTVAEETEKAKALVEKYGSGSLDYFKTYYDKYYWFSPDDEGFVSFKTAQNYAIVLENPVCRDEVVLEKMISGFDEYCRQNGLRSAYYRIPEKDIAVYEKSEKKLLPIGEESVVNLTQWTTEGSDKKGMRNAVNKLTKSGYTFHIHEPPQRDAFLQQIKAVSDDWLNDMERTEITFSQGLFDEKELKNQTILTLENAEAKVIGFVNQIPNYTRGEANFDLMRKITDAPNGTMDFLFAKMFDHLKAVGFQSCNLGMVPMSGIEEPENLQERVIKLAYEKIKHFGHYKSLRDFKEKFNPDWQMMYLVYSAPFDLIYLPSALEKIIKP